VAMCIRHACMSPVHACPPMHVSPSGPSLAKEPRLHFLALPLTWTAHLPQTTRRAAAGLCQVHAPAELCCTLVPCPCACSRRAYQCYCLWCARRSCVSVPLAWPPHTCQQTYCVQPSRACSRHAGPDGGGASHQPPPPHRVCVLPGAGRGVLQQQSACKGCLTVCVSSQVQGKGCRSSGSACKGCLIPPPSCFERCHLPAAACSHLCAQPGHAEGREAAPSLPLSCPFPKVEPLCASLHTQHARQCAPGHTRTAPTLTRAGGLPHALLLLRHRKGRLCAQPAAPRDCGPGADSAGGVWQARVQRGVHGGCAGSVWQAHVQRGVHGKRAACQVGVMETLQCI